MSVIHVLCCRPPSSLPLQLVPPVHTPVLVTSLLAGLGLLAVAGLGLGVAITQTRRVTAVVSQS